MMNNLISKKGKIKYIATEQKCLENGDDYCQTGYVLDEVSYIMA